MKPEHSKLLHNQSGLTLVEVLVAVVILAVAGGAVIQLLTNSVAVISAAEKRTMAALVVENKLVDLAIADSLSLKDKSDGKEVMGHYEYHWTIERKSTVQAGFDSFDVRVELVPDEGWGVQMSGYFNGR